MITLTEANLLANERSMERQRAEYMGWSFRNLRVEKSRWQLDAWAMSGEFRCVCGRQEEFHTVVPPHAPREFYNPARFLRRFGSFSREHLLQDGYTEEQVQEFERKGLEFDAMHGKLANRPEHVRNRWVALQLRWEAARRADDRSAMEAVSRAVMMEGLDAC